MRVREVAEFLGCTFEGDGERDVTSVAPLEAAGALQISFVASRKASVHAAKSAAGCLLVPIDFPNPQSRTVVRCPDPRGAFARVVSRFHPPARLAPGVHPTAYVAPSVELAEDVAVGPNASIAEGSRIGPRSQIGAGAAIGRRVTLGADCVLHSNVNIYDDVSIGHRAILHAGCVIGADGFGFVLNGDRYEKFPQIGRVEIGDDVEVGANACIDRAALGVTWIGDGVKLDNMVHVGHNCRLGRHVVVAAQTGFSGGVVVDDYAVIGGQVGIGDKARIESRAVLGSGCGVLTSKVIRSGEVVWGTPARPLKEILEQLANLSRLPAMREELAELRTQVSRLLEERR